MTVRTPLISDGTREARTVPLSRVEIRTADDGTVTTTGYAAVFDSASEDLGGFREVLKQGAFRKVLKAGADVRFLVNHDGIPLARSTNGTLRLAEDPRGLKIEADMPDTQQARDLVVSMERHDIDQMSFMFRVNADGREWDFPDDPAQLATRTIYEISELLDVSAVTFPAYPATEIGVRGIVGGLPIATPDGRLDRDLFDVVCGLVDDDNLDLGAADRRELDRAAEQLSTITPWQRERVLRATGNEPQNPGAAVEVPGAGVQDSDGYGLEVRRRRLAQTEKQFAVRAP